MDTTGFLEQLEHDGRLLSAAAGSADWDAPAPGIEWNLRDVVVHTGAVHRWSADIVRRGLQDNETGGSASWRVTLPDHEVLDWYGEGLSALIATLAEAPDDLEVWAFGDRVPAAAFWSRRQAHETAIHRTDVQTAAGGEVTPFGPPFAQDGLAELLGGFACERGFATPTRGTLGFLASDGDDWRVTFGGERNIVERSVDLSGVDATVSGSSSDLYRWAWNRPSPAVVDGDPAVVELWRLVQVT